MRKNVNTNRKCYTNPEMRYKTEPEVLYNTSGLELRYLLNSLATSMEGHVTKATKQEVEDELQLMFRF